MLPMMIGDARDGVRVLKQVKTGQSNLTLLTSDNTPRCVRVGK